MKSRKKIRVLAGRKVLWMQKAEGRKEERRSRRLEQTDMSLGKVNE